MNKPCEFCGKQTYPPRIAMVVSGSPKLNDRGRYLKIVDPELSYAHHKCAREEIKLTKRIKGAKHENLPQG